MTYDNFATYPFDQFAPLIVGGIILAVVAIIFLIVESCTETGRKAALFGISALALILGLVTSITALGYSYDEVTSRNEVTAENNLQKKYDIEAVIWDESNTFPNSTDLNKIAVQDKNSNILKFQYRVDKETHEPYLLNDSGNTPVKANELLLKK